MATSLMYAMTVNDQIATLVDGTDVINGTVLFIGAEQMQVLSAISGTTTAFRVKRGVDGTSSSAHAAGSQVRVVDAEDAVPITVFTIPSEMAHVPSSLTSIVTLSDVVGTTQSLTLTVKNAAGTTLPAINLLSCYWTNEADGSSTEPKADDQNDISVDEGNVYEGDGLSAGDAARTVKILTNDEGVFEFEIDNSGASATFDLRFAIAFVDGVIVSDTFAIPNA